MLNDKISVHVIDQEGKAVGDIVLAIDTPEKMNYRAKRFSEKTNRIAREAAKAYKTLTQCNEEEKKELARAWGCESITDLFKRWQPFSIIGNEHIYLSVLTDAMERAVNEAFRENKRSVTVKINA